MVVPTEVAVRLEPMATMVEPAEHVGDAGGAGEDEAMQAEPAETRAMQAELAEPTVAMAETAETRAMQVELPEPMAMQVELPEPRAMAELAAGLVKAMAATLTVTYGDDMRDGDVVRSDGDGTARAARDDCRAG